MKNLIRLAIVGVLIVATGGIVPAAAVPPEPVQDPTVTVGLTADCVDGELEATATVELDPPTATMIDFNMGVNKIGKVPEEDIPYQPSINQESWGFYGWNSTDPIPPLPYTLYTSHLEWGNSWNQHSKVFGVTFESTGFFDVYVSASAATPKANRGRGNQSRVSDYQNWTADCTAGNGPASVETKTEFTWCHEDAWTNAQYGPGLVTFDPTTGGYIDCPY